MDVPLVQPSDLSVRDAKLVQHIGSNVRHIDVVYARMDEDMLLSSTGYDGAPLRPGLLAAITDGNLTRCQCAGERSGRRQGDLRVRPGDD